MINMYNKYERRVHMIRVCSIFDFSSNGDSDNIRHVFDFVTMFGFEINRQLLRAYVT